VLLYEVAKCRNIRGANRPGELQNVFDQYSRVGHDDAVTGGVGKHICLKDGHLGRAVVHDLVKTPCRDIIEKLRTLFHDFYLHDTTGDDISPETHLFYKCLREEDPRVKDAREKLRSSQWILDMINAHLASKWDVDNDGSLHSTLLRPNPTASGDRPKRKAPDDDDKRVNKIHKGGLLPSESVLSGNGSSSGSRGRPTRGSRFFSTSSRSASHTTYSSFASCGSNLNPGAG